MEGIHVLSHRPGDGCAGGGSGELDGGEVREAIGRVHAAYPDWRRRSVEERAAIVARAADLFEARADELAAIMTLEMGKRINEGRGEIGIVVDIFRYYADHGPALLADESLKIKGGQAV